VRRVCIFGPGRPRRRYGIASSAAAFGLRQIEIEEEVLPRRLQGSLRRDLPATRLLLGRCALKALGRSNHPDVANLIGYANRKLGNYDESRIWYEAALKADPSRVRTWQYYGLWQLEQGNRAQAQVHLDRIAALCGRSCPEYRSLSEAMGVVAAGGRPVY
jgi:tetratricopeptide (TPR) repeat protein